MSTTSGFGSRQRPVRGAEPVPRGRRVGIWAKTLGLAVGYAAATALTHVLFMRHWVEATFLSLGLAFSIVQMALIVAVTAHVLTAKYRSQLKERRARRVLPLVREAIAEHTVEGDQAHRLRGLRRRFPEEVERCAIEFLATVAGTAREHLTQLAEQLGLIELWRHQYRSHNVDVRLAAIAKLALLTADVARSAFVALLEDDEEAVRIEAARALMRVGQASDVDRVFDFALTQSLLVRTFLANDLRWYLPQLCRTTIPEVLASGDAKKIKITLVMLKSWEVHLPLEGIRFLLRHPNADLRALALRVLPYAVGLEGFEREVLMNLEEEIGEVRAASAYAAGKMKISGALPLLRECLSDPDERVAVTAAYAIAEQGEGGLQLLDAEALGGGRSAAVALEALEKARIERLYAMGI